MKKKKHASQPGFQIGTSYLLVICRPMSGHVCCALSVQFTERSVLYKKTGRTSDRLCQRQFTGFRTSGTD